MTLLEVLVAATLFAMLAVGLTASYINNFRFAKAQSYRTQAITAAMSIVEQLRANGYTDILNNCYTPADPLPLVVRVLDPTSTTTVPTLYRDLSLEINARDGTVIESNWTETNLDIEPAPNAPKLPMRFWVILNGDIATSGNVRQVFQLALVYQWRVPTPNSSWQTGNMRMIIPRIAPSSK